MKRTLSLIGLATICLVASLRAAPAASAAVQSYTGCLSPILNAVYDVAPGESPAHPPCLRPANEIHLSSGDLTALVAGTGLTGGGDNGSVTVGIAPSYRLPQGCSSGQATSWNGSAWACASFLTQADFNSLVALLGTPGTINNSSNPVHWTKLKGVPAGFADGTDDTGPAYAAGFGLNLSSQTFSVDPAQVQRRIAGDCAAGSSNPRDRSGRKRHLPGTQRVHRRSGARAHRQPVQRRRRRRDAGQALVRSDDPD